MKAWVVCLLVFGQSSSAAAFSKKELGDVADHRRRVDF